MTHTRRISSHRHSCLIWLIVLVILVATTHVSGEEDPLAAILTDIDAKKSNIERLRNNIVNELGDLLPTVNKVLRYEQEVGDQLSLGLKRLASVPSEKSAATLMSRVENQFHRLSELVVDVQQRMAIILAERGEAPTDELLEYEYQLGEYDDLLSRLLLELVNNVGVAETLGMESRESVGQLEDTLIARAEQQSDRLDINHARVEGTEARLARAADGQRVVLEKELVVLEEREQRIARGLAVTISTLGTRNLETNQYVTTLAGVTGELSPDLFDADIILGIAESWVDVTRQSLAQNGPAWLFKAIVFLVILILAKIFSKLTGRLVARAVSASPMNFSTLLQQFFTKLATNIVLGIGLLIALAQLGIHLGPVLAGLGVAGLVVGFALQDTLSNFASGLMILIYRPYDVGDVIEAGGVSGKVQRMNLVSTTIQTFDNQKLLVPNNKIWGDVIRNVNAAPTRRVDLIFGIGYDDDVNSAEKILNDIIANQKLVLKEPEPVIKLHALNESSVDFIVRPWVNAEDYWTVHWNITRAVKEEFTAAGISIPYPQQDVHLYQHAAGRDESPQK